MTIKEEIDRLSKFILKEYPLELGRGNFKDGESAVDVAIRLLSREDVLITIAKKGEENIHTFKFVTGPEIIGFIDGKRVEEIGETLSNAVGEGLFTCAVKGNEDCDGKCVMLLEYGQIVYCPSLDIDHSKREKDNDVAGDKCKHVPSRGEECGYCQLKKAEEKEMEGKE